MNNNVDPARYGAKRAVLSIWRGETLLGEALFRDLEAPDRARALRLSRETLRHTNGFDALILPLFERKPKDDIRAILHLGLYEIIVDGGAPHGVVSSYVDLAKSEPKTKRSAGLVNAVLRKFNSDSPIPTSDRFGSSLRKKLISQYGKAKTQQINKAQSTMPPHDLAWKSAPQGDEPLARTFGVTRVDNKTHISVQSGYSEGEFWVQDMAARIPALCFDNIENQPVLDLCAAPGGKTMQLAAMGAQVTAVDISKKRAIRISENLTRTGLKATLQIDDVLAVKGQWPNILLDAPCTATGTLRRHPDLRFQKPLHRLRALLPLQAKMLRHAYKCLEPGGELIYCVCSLLAEEGEEQIHSFVSQSDAKIVDLDPQRFGLSKKHAPFIRSFPSDNAEIGGMDGFFVAKLTKTP